MGSYQVQWLCRLEEAMQEWVMAEQGGLPFSAPPPTCPQFLQPQREVHTELPGRAFVSAAAKAGTDRTSIRRGVAGPSSRPELSDVRCANLGNSVSLRRKAYLGAGGLRVSTLSEHGCAGGLPELMEIPPTSERPSVGPTPLPVQVPDNTHGERQGCRLESSGP